MRRSRRPGEVLASVRRRGAARSRSHVSGTTEGAYSWPAPEVAGSGKARVRRGCSGTRGAGTGRCHAGTVFLGRPERRPAARRSSGYGGCSDRSRLAHAGPSSSLMCEVSSRPPGPRVATQSLASSHVLISSGTRTDSFDRWGSSQAGHGSSAGASSMWRSYFGFNRELAPQPVRLPS